MAGINLTNERPDTRMKVRVSAFPFFNLFSERNKMSPEVQKAKLLRACQRAAIAYYKLEKAVADMKKLNDGQKPCMGSSMDLIHYHLHKELIDCGATGLTE